MGIVTRRGWAVLGLIAVMALAPVRSADRFGLLDGMVFVGFYGAQGKALDPAEREEMSFERGIFRSASCEPYGFAPTPYRARREGDLIHFEATITSPTHGTIAWKGSWDGKTARATYVWRKERLFWDTRREYWFQGVLTE